MLNVFNTKKTTNLTYIADRKIYCISVYGVWNAQVWKLFFLEDLNEEKDVCCYQILSEGTLNVCAAFYTHIWIIIEKNVCVSAEKFLLLNSHIGDKNLV